ncbi:uncharacterized protein LOC144706174 [Wolffia australiana]
MESVSGSSVRIGRFVGRREWRVRFCAPARVRCGLRDAGARGQLWRSRFISTEAIQAVQALKLAKSLPSSSSELEFVFDGRIKRLLKVDLIAVLEELQRQNKWDLALQVFRFIRGEVWYEPDLRLYSDMIYMAGKNKLVEIAENLFAEMKEEGLTPDSRAYSELIGAFFQANMVGKAMETYRVMKESAVTPTEFTFTILIRNLEKAEEHDLASSVRRDCEMFLDCPEKFLKEVDKKYPKRRSIKVF